MAKAIWEKYEVLADTHYETREEKLYGRYATYPSSATSSSTGFTFDENNGLFTLKNIPYGYGDTRGFYIYGSQLQNSNITNNGMRQPSDTIYFVDSPGTGSGTYRVQLTKKLYSVIVFKNLQRGRFIGNVTAEEGTYPITGAKDGYWYEYAGLANQAPSITGSSTQIGDVKKDFTISYTVSDPDGDEVKVQIMVDNKVIQYPMAVPLNRAQSVDIRLGDYALGNHTITVTATDTSNASATRTYYFSKTNVAPTISGSDMDLGGKYKAFIIDYIVQDADGDTVKVEIKVDGAIKQSPTTTTLGVSKFFTVPIKSMDLGRHTIEIIATDGQGAKSTRAYTFQKVNSAPVISGQDENLGAKNTGFSYTYDVTDNEADRVNVYEKLNGEIIKVKDNITLGATQTITITDSQIKDFELNGLNTIEIEATDGTATTYRRVTFVRNNMPPIIADKDKDLGNKTNSLSYSWSATDPEKDKMTATIYLDDKILKARHAINEGANQTISIKGMDMFKIRPGKHEICLLYTSPSPRD